MSLTTRRVATTLSAAALAVAGLATVPDGASAAPDGDRKRGCDQRSLQTTSQLLACVGARSSVKHLQALQAIADANDGNRASGTPGYDASVDYVADKLESFGWDVTVQPFDFFYYAEESTVTLDGEVLQPSGGTDGDYFVFTYSGSGQVTSDVLVPTNDVVVPIDPASPPSTSNSGCEASDFEPAPAEDAVALVQRGTCTFATKAANAQAAGYDAVVVFNEGQPGRDGVVAGTLGEESFGQVTIPVIGVSYADGVDLIENGGTLSIEVDVTAEERETYNVIADRAGRNTDNVVMAGAHLDSVPEGPGINDNGTGSAALLDLAQALGRAKYTPQNSLRLAWWGAEEAGLLGSEHYVSTLPAEELDRIAAYLNFDMVGSPNYIYGVYDADQSSFQAPAGVPVPEGSAQLEDLFEAFYSKSDIPYEDSQFSGRSDYQAFIEAGIPSSGLFTGAEVAKTPEQEAIWGGTAGVAYDACYHQACDDIDNVNREALDTNVDAIAFALFNLAATTESVNGVPGTRVRGPQPSRITLDGPAGTVGSQAGGSIGGGGLGVHDHDHEGVAS